MTKITKWIYAHRPDPELTPACYRLETSEEELRPVRGELAVEGLYYSVDPYMRIQQSVGDTWEAPHPLDEVQGGSVVGRVVGVGPETPGFAVGDVVETYMGWRSHGVVSAASARRLDPEAAPVTTALHVLGMTGRIAWFGLIEAGRPKPGDTLVVSGAAGAVGSIVGQIGRLAGCQVIGIVGTPEKADWITSELGFHHALSYREHATAAAMAKAITTIAPRGADVYFDNTGGHTTDAVISTMNLRARIVICGQISQYQGGLDDPALGPRLLHRFLYQRATLQGVLARDYTARMDEMLAAMTPWVQSADIRYRETLVEGFERLPEALCGLFEGKNFGKMIVKA